MRYSFEIIESEFDSRVLEIKDIYKSELDYPTFWQIVHNLKNGTTANEYNSLSLEEWVRLYSKYNISVTENQLESVFEYLGKYYSSILRRIEERTYSEFLTSNISEDDNPFGLEMVVLKSMAISA